jgi:hypothetical protein
MSEQVRPAALTRPRFRPLTPQPLAVGALALVGTGMVQTWAGMAALGSLSRPGTFVMPSGPEPVLLSAARALLGLLACAAGLSAGAGRRWGLLAGIAIAALGCGVAMAGSAVG